MYMDYVMYQEKLYFTIKQGNDKYIVTYDSDKTNNGFFSKFDYYMKRLEDCKNDVDCIFDVSFYVTYVNKTKTVKGKKKWSVSEYVPLHRGFDIEKNEVGIWANGMSRSNDWIQFDSCACSKIVDISECSDFTVRYEYSRKDGVDYEEPLIEEQEVSAEEFKRIMISYRRQNI